MLGNDDTNIVKKYFYKLVFIGTIAYLLNSFGVLADNIVAARYLETEALIAMGLVSPIPVFIMMFGDVSAVGAYICATKSKGMNRHEEVNEYFSYSLIWLLVIGIVFSIAGYFFADAIAGFLGGTGEIKMCAADYIRGYSIVLISILSVNTLLRFVRLDGAPAGFSLVCVLVNVVLNVLFDYFVIVVLKGGLFLLALATGAASLCSCLVVCSHFLRKVCTLKLCRPKEIAYKTNNIKNTSLPIIAHQAASFAMPYLLNRIFIAYDCISVVSAYNIAAGITGFLLAPALAAASAIDIIGGLLFGERDRDALRMLLKTSLKYAGFAGMLCAAVMFCFPDLLLSVYQIPAQDIYEAARFAIIVLGIALPVKALDGVFVSLYQVIGREKIAVAVSAMKSLILPVACSLLIMPFVRDYKVLLALLLSEILVALLIILFVCLKHKRVPDSLDDFLLYTDEEFSGDAQITAHIEKDISKVMEFTRSISAHEGFRSISSKMLNDITLFIEEACSSIIKYSYTSQNNCQIDILIVNHEERITVRFRYEGRQFNLIDAYNKNSEDEEMLGMKIIIKKTLSARYFRAFDINYLVIDIDKAQER